MTTAGNLVFQGTSDGRFVAYSADKGKKLWEVPVESGIIAGPMTYEVDGVQYVTVSAGWGGAFALIGGDAAVAAGTRPGGAVLTYALASKSTPMAAPAVDPDVAKGEKLFHHNCALCHGAGAISGSGVPDLRHSAAAADPKALALVVKNGVPGTGMAPLGKWVSEDEAKLIQKYLMKRAADEKLGK
jgi:quinohemoprotein ethanol dehydrogenase